MKNMITGRCARYAVTTLSLALALPMAAQAAEQLTQADTNKDGKISRAEAKAAQSRSFERLDSNGNGQLDRQEFDKGQPGLPANADAQDKQRRQSIITGWFDNIDSNGDGKISESEYQQAVAPYFDRMDSNGDGSISSDELKKAFHNARPGSQQSGSN
ncbi:EF-hand domain-containing protein [Salinisphaera sp. SPP-AMP-43]|uniref:EF-hand domain-containing protein n=1 Tax=Salinisphaera sp. SPP-AMP-43 TaxID=3121288 RepID=UPI003C6DF4FF